MSEIEKNEIIQIAPPHKWGGCLAVVAEPKSSGCLAYVSMPANDGEPPGQAYIRLNRAEYVRLDVKAIYVPEEGP